jgi:arsenate reductase-like glutaredoxin family protein
MRYREQQITDIYAVTTENLIRALNLSTSTAEDLLRIKGEVPRSLNAQASLTENDVREIAEFHVH